MKAMVITLGIAFSLFMSSPAAAQQPECGIHIYTHTDGLMQVEIFGSGCQYQEASARTNDTLVKIIKDVSSEFVTTVTWEA